MSPHRSSSGAGGCPSRGEMGFCHRIWLNNDGFFIYWAKSSVLGAGGSEMEEPMDQQTNQGAHKELGREEGFLCVEGAAATSF